jgi:hypothetical protein
MRAKEKETPEEQEERIELLEEYAASLQATSDDLLMREKIAAVINGERVDH